MFPSVPCSLFLFVSAPSHVPDVNFSAEQADAVDEAVFGVPRLEFLGVASLLAADTSARNLLHISQCKKEHSHLSSGCHLCYFLYLACG